MVGVNAVIRALLKRNMTKLNGSTSNVLPFRQVPKFPATTAQTSFRLEPRALNIRVFRTNSLSHTEQDVASHHYRSPRGIFAAMVDRCKCIGPPSDFVVVLVFWSPEFLVARKIHSYIETWKPSQERLHPSRPLRLQSKYPRKSRHSR